MEKQQTRRETPRGPPSSSGEDLPMVTESWEAVHKEVVKWASSFLSRQPQCYTKRQEFASGVGTRCFEEHENST